MAYWIYDETAPAMATSSGLDRRSDEDDDGAANASSASGASNNATEDKHHNNISNHTRSVDTRSSNDTDNVSDSRSVNTISNATSDLQDSNVPNDSSDTNTRHVSDHTSEAKPPTTPEKRKTPTPLSPRIYGTVVPPRPNAPPRPLSYTYAQIVALRKTYCDDLAGAHLRRDRAHAQADANVHLATKLEQQLEAMRASACEVAAAEAGLRFARSEAEYEDAIAANNQRLIDDLHRWIGWLQEIIDEWQWEDRRVVKHMLFWLPEGAQ